jgi:hypothetical protein
MSDLTREEEQEIQDRGLDAQIERYEEEQYRRKVGDFQPEEEDPPVAPEEIEYR